MSATFVMSAVHALRAGRESTLIPGSPPLPACAAHARSRTSPRGKRSGFRGEGLSRSSRKARAWRTKDDGRPRTTFSFKLMCVRARAHGPRRASRPWSSLVGAKPLILLDAPRTTFAGSFPHPWGVPLPIPFPPLPADPVEGRDDSVLVGSPDPVRLKTKGLAGDFSDQDLAL